MAGAETAQGRTRPARRSELLLALWRLLASAEFAVALIGFLAVTGLLAVVVPQVPAPIRDNPAAVDAWLELQKGTFGPLTEPLHRVGVFNVVRAWWFLGALGALVVAVSVFTADRFVSIWRNVTQPRTLVPDSFFDRAANRIAFTTARVAAGSDPADRLQELLRRRRFRVTRLAQGGATHLFADRFAWAQLGTFVSHLALIMFLAGGLTSRLGGYTNALFIAEGTTSPVFAVSHPKQMQIEVVDAAAAFDDEGTPLDYRTELVIYQGGREVAKGVATVNDPFAYGGYRFHQAGYLGEGAALRVVDVATGNTVYREALALDGLVPAPSVVVRDAAGVLLLDDVIVPTDFVEGTGGTLMTVPGSGRQYWVGVTQEESGAWNLVVYGRESDDTRLVVPAGESRLAGGLEWTFVEATGLPSVVVSGVPGDKDLAMAVLAETPEGEPYLTLLGPVDGRALTLYPDQPVRIEDREYRFEGRREFAGIEVRRDPGAKFIWLAAGLLLGGLLITFYLPRLRLWVRTGSDETVIASVAERRGVFQSEARELMRELGTTEIERGEGGGVDA